MASIKVQVTIQKRRIMLQFDAQTAGPIIVTPKIARWLAAELHQAADQLDPRSHRNGISRR